MQHCLVSMGNELFLKLHGTHPGVSWFCSVSVGSSFGRNKGTDPKTGSDPKITF